MADSSINLNVYKRQITYLKELMSKLDTIVPEKKRHRYHLIFRNQIIESYDTLEECLKGYELHSKYLCCVKYYPLSDMVTKIQALWQGYHQRRKQWDPNIMPYCESINNTQPFHIPIPCKETVNKIPNVKKKLIFE